MGKRSKKSEAAAVLGKLGGEASARKLSPKQRREKARKAVLARWARAKRKGAG